MIFHIKEKVTEQSGVVLSNCYLLSANCVQGTLLETGCLGATVNQADPRVVGELMLGGAH